MNPYQHQIPLNETIQLANYSTRGRDFATNRPEAEAEFRSLREEFADWQHRLYAADNEKLLIIFQAIDAGGKDGSIRAILRGVNPQGVRVTSFKVPSRQELAHDFLWRIHQAVPGKGMIGLFNRSHYEDVLVVRVDQIVPEPVWRGRYALINDFEKLLTQTGTRIIKFFLHLSKKEQQERLQARLDDPTKNWKFELGDLSKRAQWDEYQVAFEEMLTRCHTPEAPWHIIPADQKWYRNLALMRVLVHTIRDMNPQFPTVKEDFTNITIT